MRLKTYLWLLPLVTLVQIAEASKSLAPSRIMSVCERFLIAKDLYQPPQRAFIHPNSPRAELYPGHWVKIEADGRTPIFYSRTNYGLSTLVDFRWFPKSLLDVENWKKMRVLDLASGEGVLVEDLRRMGVDAVGVDVYLDPYQMSKGYFVKADVVDTGLSSNCCDLIISVQGPFSHELDNKEFIKELFFEVRRLLKPGGRFLISALPIRSIKELPPLPNGLKLRRWPNQDWLSVPAPAREDGRAQFWIEIVRE